MHGVVILANHVQYLMANIGEALLELKRLPSMVHHSHDYTCV